MSSRTLRIVCAVSILLNIFLVAAAIGGAAWIHARRPMIVAGSIRVAGAELPQDRRRAFRHALREVRREMQPMVIAGRQARQRAATLLRAPTLDPVALGAALARIRAADFALRARIEARAIDFAATLPSADRAKLAAGLLRRPAAGTRR